MKTKLNGVFSIALVFTLMGCQQVSNENVDTPTVTVENPKETANEPMSEKEQKVVEKMQWVESADAKADAQKSLKNSTGDKPELIAFAGRNLSFPGLTSAQYEEIKGKITPRYAEGSGDVLYGDTHKAMRKKLHAYASEYNAVVYSAVLK